MQATLTNISSTLLSLLLLCPATLNVANHGSMLIKFVCILTRCLALRETLPVSAFFPDSLYSRLARSKYRVVPKLSFLLRGNNRRAILSRQEMLRVCRFLLKRKKLSQGSDPIRHVVSLATKIRTLRTFVNNSFA